MQWGTGDVGVHALRLIMQSRDLSLTGVKCYTSARDGCDVGDIIGEAPSGIQAQIDSAGRLKAEADCVLFMPRDSFLDPTAVTPEPAWLEELITILESGKNVVSPILSPMHWRQLAHGAALRDRLDAASRKGGVSLFFTGVEPGFVSDCLAITLSSAIGNIEQIRSLESLDYGNYNPDALKSMGFGYKPDISAEAARETLAPCWGSALYLVADSLGIVIDDVRVDIESFLSPDDFVASGGLEIKAGTVGAQQWSLTAIAEGEERIVIRHVSRAGPHMAPDWPQVGQFGGYGVEIDAKPPITIQIPLGLPGGTGDALSDAILMTAARCVNAISAIVEAPAGYHLLSAMPIYGGRHGIAGRR